MNRLFSMPAESSVRAESTFIFKIKPIAVVIQLAFAGGMMASEAQAQSCLDSVCTIGGNYNTGIDLSQFAGKDGRQDNDPKVRKGEPGNPVSLDTSAATVITQRNGAPALQINTRGGNGAPQSTEVIRHGGAGANAGSVNVNLNHDITLRSAGKGLVINAKGGHAAGASMDSNRTPGGAGANVTVNLATASRFTANTRPDLATAGMAKEVIDIDSSGGHGVNGISGTFTVEDGSDGGKGGNVILNMPGKLAMQSDQASLIRIISNGGDGGNVSNATSLASHRAGYAGDGGDQTVNLGQAHHAGELISHANGAAAIVMSSQGGKGGNAQKGNFGARLASNGGKGGQLTLDLKNINIKTGQAQSIAIALESIGGVGGGPGDGANKNAKLRGDGGAGGALAVTTDASTWIQTAGQNSDGIYAASLGGGGSRGHNGAITSTNGAQGGKGGDITINNQASISTLGKGAQAIYAESSGGSSGDGGGAAINFIARGSSGGRAGLGGNVTVNQQGGTLETAGDDSHVIVAQSIGGTRGEMVDADFTVDNTQKAYALGGVNGAPDDGNASTGRVTVNNQGSLLSKGNHASAVIAQSIGGGGGMGGSSFGFVAIGGTAGASGDGGTVNVSNRGLMATEGEFSPTIIAQSIGGGGGLGGKASSALVGLPNIVIGGKAGKGGNGGAVNVNNQGGLFSIGNHSAAIVASSIGGGGGMGGSAQGVGAFQVTNFVLGAEGGKGGNGGQVTVNNTHTVLTVGNNAQAILAKSIGGGGGMGGNASSVVGASLNNLTIGGNGGVAGKGGNISLSNRGSLLTSGQESTALMAQSIGGGGGIGGSASALSIGGFPAGTSGEQVTSVIAIGGKGGSGNVGGLVQLDNSGMIRTTGNDASGVSLQSIGGGGGMGGGATASTIEIPRGDTLTLKVAIGGSGGNGNAGGAVNFKNSGSIQTAGQLSSGVSLQSIGGGGGDGAVGSINGFVYSGNGAIDKATADKTRYELGASIGGKGGSGGKGGRIDFVNSGDILTYGDASPAVLAQSIGGGGGNGGASHADSTKHGRGIKFELGGDGGKGNHGGEVALSNTGVIKTVGQLSVGIHAQSVGGGGGTGGSTGASASEAEKAMYDLNKDITKNIKKYQNVTEKYKEYVNKAIAKIVPQPAKEKKDESKKESANKNFDVRISMGGKGGDGGDGGKVIVTNSNLIETVGDLSTVILAQSVGGGGGSGGNSQAIGTDAKSTQVNLSMGGSGSGGGKGGEVIVNNLNALKASGIGSHAIVAQSIGGGGGHAGSSTINAGFTEQNQINLALGGNGGRGGMGGTVTVTNRHQVESADGQAIIAQSIGGGGGMGGAVETTLKGDKEKTSKTTVALTVGGSGGTAGDGGAVNVNHANGILRSGALNGSVLLAQSIGGGGGSAGFSKINQESKADTAVNMAVGGQGGAGGRGGEVTVTNNSLIHASQGTTMGIVAQSIGGGGGNANYVESNGGQARKSLQIALGGKGGTAGTGGKVSVTQTSSQAMQTTGTGIVAQSIGGGGGMASMAVAQAQAGDGYSLNLSLGGVRGSKDSSNNGHGGQVNVLVQGAGIQTSGNYASGIIAQSIGGGGGIVDLSNKTINQSSRLESLQLGGTRAHGDGKTVNVQLGAGLVTQGKNSHGIVAQSIGGGGGILLADGLSLPVYMRVGGEAAKPHADTVTIKLDKNAFISTSGDGSYGILAQSIGGGGGMAADTSILNLRNVGKGMPDSVKGESSSKGGHVVVELDGHIATSGRNAQGIFAQSLSQGGGLSNWGMGSQAPGSTGKAGEIKIKLGERSPASIRATGAGSIGIVAQTMDASDKRVEISLKNNSLIEAETGVYMIGGDKNSNLSLDSSRIHADTALLIKSSQDVNLTLKNGARITGKDKNNYILVEDGNPSNNKKTRILLESGSEMSGSIRVNDKRKVTVDNNGGIVNLGHTWILGTGGEFYNKATASIGGSDIARTYFQGKFEMQKGGNLIVDADFETKRNDVLTVAGEARFNEGSTMTVNGRNLVPGASATIIDRSDTLYLDKNFTVNAMQGDVVTYKRDHVMLAGTNQLVIRPQGNFTGSAMFEELNEDQRSVAQYLQTTWEQEELVNSRARQAALNEDQRAMAAASLKEEEPVNVNRRAMVAASVQEEAPANDNQPQMVETNEQVQVPGLATPGVVESNNLYALFGEMDDIGNAQVYQRVLNNLASDALIAPASMMPMHNRQFINKMVSCDLTGGQAVRHDNTCLWVDGRYNESRMDRNADDFGYKMRSSIIQLGGEYQFNENWSAGASIGFDHLNVNAKGIDLHTKGDTVVGGVFIKHTEGQRELAASLSTMYGSYDTRRVIDLPQSRYTANSKWKSWLHSLNLHAGYTFPWQQGYIKPSVDVSLQYQRNPAYKENGAGALNLNVAKQSQWTVMISPQVEASQTYESGDYLVRPYASLGASWMSNKNWTSRMQLQGGSSTDWITMKSDLPNLLGNAKVGVNVMHSKGVDVNLEYAHQWGKRYRSSTGWLKVGYKF
ncbi:MAG: autotransporter outer membrane beta-barrel domain-containing protein [Advenella sp.]